MQRCVQFGYPYQYNQAGMGWKKALWTANVGVRLLFSKVLPQLFFPPVALTFAQGSVQHKGSWDTLYRDTLEQGNKTTRNLMILLGAAAIAVFAVVVKGQLA